MHCLNRCTDLSQTHTKWHLLIQNVATWRASIGPNIFKKKKPTSIWTNSFCSYCNLIAQLNSTALFPHTITLTLKHTMAQCFSSCRVITICTPLKWADEGGREGQICRGLWYCSVVICPVVKKASKIGLFPLRPANQNSNPGQSSKAHVCYHYVWVFEIESNNRVKLQQKWRCRLRL